MNSTAHLAEILITNLQKNLQANGKTQAVLGISGGVDSAVVACIAAQAIGAKNIIALRLPHSDFSSEANLKDARKVCEMLELDAQEIDIAPFCAPLFQLDFVNKPMTRGNIMARMRMIVLYAAANEHDAVVLGTGNKTELLTGFFTKYGDGGVDIEVLGEVWKTEVFALARHFELPENIYTKAPSAELVLNHTDEKELGINYPALDAILQKMEDERDFVAANASEVLVERLVAKSAHKRGEVPILERS